MRILNSKEINIQDISISNISKGVDLADKSKKSTLKPGMAEDNEGKSLMDIVEISNLAKDLYEKLKDARDKMDDKEDKSEQLAKILEIARRISKGERVPVSDEKKLMEYSFELYQAAKLAALLHANKDKKKHDALFDDENKKETEAGEELSASYTVVSKPEIPVRSLWR